MWVLESWEGFLTGNCEDEEAMTFQCVCVCVFACVQSSICVFYFVCVCVCAEGSLHVLKKSENGLNTLKCLIASRPFLTLYK